MACIFLSELIPLKKEREIQICRSLPLYCLSLLQSQATVIVCHLGNFDACPALFQIESVSCMKRVYSIGLSKVNLVINSCIIVLGQRANFSGWTDGLNNMCVLCTFSLSWVSSTLDLWQCTYQTQLSAVLLLVLLSWFSPAK